MSHDDITNIGKEKMHQNHFWKMTLPTLYFGGWLMGKGVRGLKRRFFHLEMWLNQFLTHKHQEWTSIKLSNETHFIWLFFDRKLKNKKMYPKNVITWILIATLVSHLTNMRVTVLISLLLPLFCFKIQHILFNLITRWGYV